MKNLNDIYLIYIAGPFRAKLKPGQTEPDQWEQENNVRRAEALALTVWRAGHACICPHANTRHFQGAGGDDIWLNGDLKMIERCDGVLLTPDWRNSSGASAEAEYAESLGIPCSEDLGHLLSLIRERRCVRLNPDCPGKPFLLSERERVVLQLMRDHYFRHASQAERHIGEKPIWKQQFDNDMERVRLLDRFLKGEGVV